MPIIAIYFKRTAKDRSLLKKVRSIARQHDTSVSSIFRSALRKFILYPEADNHARIS